jgi:hypothetical protein
MTRAVPTSETPDIDAREAAQDRVNARRRLVVTVLGGIGCALIIGLFALAMGWAKAHHSGDIVITGLVLLYMAAIVGVAEAMTRAQVSSCGGAITPAARRYGRRIALALCAYALVFLIATTLGRHPVTPEPLVWVLALAPIVPLLAVLATMALYLKEETDDFQRNLQLEGAMWASLALLLVATTWGFLQQFGLADAPPIWMAFPLWVVFLSFARGLIARRYR